MTFGLKFFFTYYCLLRPDNFLFFDFLLLEFLAFFCIMFLVIHSRNKLCIFIRSIYYFYIFPILSPICGAINHTIDFYQPRFIPMKILDRWIFYNNLLARDFDMKPNYEYEEHFFRLITTHRYLPYSAYYIREHFNVVYEAKVHKQSYFDYFLKNKQKYKNNF